MCIGVASSQVKVVVPRKELWGFLYRVGAGIYLTRGKCGWSLYTLYTANQLKTVASSGQTS